MNDKRGFDRVVAQWLDDGSDKTPPEVIDAVLLAVRSTPQERHFRNLWRTPPVTMYLRVATVIAVVAVAGVAALYAFGSGPNVGSGPTPTTQPTLTPPPTAVPAGIGQVVEAINSRDVAALRSSFAAGANVVLPQIRSDGLQEDAASDWGVSVDGFLETWMGTIAAWDMEAALRSCQAEAESTFRCDVSTLWHVMQVEIGEEWTFEFDGPDVTRLEMARVEPSPANRTLPLGYDDLASWESWLEGTHPELAARLSGNEMIWPFYFRYHPEGAEAIGVAIREYLESQRQP